MWQVHCFPLCPFSRKVRLALAEGEALAKAMPPCLVSLETSGL